MDSLVKKTSYDSQEEKGDGKSFWTKQGVIDPCAPTLFEGVQWMMIPS
jgi:hypothetical protein